MNLHRPAQCALTLGLAAALLPGQQSAPGASSPRDLRSLLPPRTVALVELRDAPGQLSAAQGWLRSLGPRATVVAGLLPLWFRASTGVDLVEALEVLGPHQLLLAACLRSGQPEPLLLSRIREPAAARGLLHKLPKPWCWRIDRGVLVVARHQDLLARKVTVGRAARLRGPKAAAGVGEAGIRGFVDLAFFRRRSGRQFYPQLQAGPLFLFGPLAKALDRGRRIDAALQIGARGLRLRARLDVGVADRSTAAGRLLGHGARIRRAPPEPVGTLVALSIDRDPPQFFKQLEALLSPARATAAQALVTNFDNLLGKVSFVNDLLPALRYPGALFVTETAALPVEDAPRIQLPAFSLVLPLAGTRDRLVKRGLAMFMGAFGLVTTANRTRLKQLPSGLRLRNTRAGEYRLQTLAYDAWEGKGRPPTESGLAVTLVFAHGHMVLSSTRDGAIRAARALAQGGGKEIRGDHLRVDGARLGRLLRRHVDLLVLDRVLKEGDSWADARQFWAGVLEVLPRIGLDVNLLPAKTGTELSLVLGRIQR